MSMQFMVRDFLMHAVLSQCAHCSVKNSAVKGLKIMVFPCIVEDKINV